MPTLLFSNDENAAIGDMTAVPVFLTDGSVGDTTTGPTESSDSDPASVGDPCGASHGVAAAQVVVWVGDGPSIVTDISVTGRARREIDGFGSACPDPPPSEDFAYTSELYSSPDGVVWTLFQSDAVTNNVFETFTFTGEKAALYIKRLLKVAYSTENSTNGIDAFAQNTDFRVTATECEIPPTPTLTYEKVGSDIIFTMTRGD